MIPIGSDDRPWSPSSSLHVDVEGLGPTSTLPGLANV